MQEGMVKVEKTENAYRIFKGEYYTNKLLLVEADWSAAAFVFAWSAAIDCSLGMRYLDLKSKQGDKAIADFFSNMGLIVNSTKFGEVQGVSFKSTLSNTPQDLKFDFTNTPDLFPIIAAVCAYLKIKSKFTGVKNLVLKESNRIKAMQENLLQTGAEINIVQDDELHLNFNNQVKENYFFKTYNDHRIAMACSIFAFQKDIIIEDETVVQKSFPTYWKMFRDLGFISN